MTLRQEALATVRLLPEEKLPQLIQFARFLNPSAKEKESTAAIPSQHDKNRRTPGIFPGKVIMSDDFDETPDCFKEYL